MSTNVSSVTKHFPSAQNGFTTTTSGSVSSGATTVGLNSVAGYTNGETAVFVIDPTDATKKQTFTGVIDTAGVQVTGVVWTAGTNQSHALGATVVDYETATHWNMVTKGILVDHEQTGSHDTLTDSNGNEWLERGVTASAVNHLKSTNAATGNPPVLSATGSDTNIDLKLDPKGSGQVYIDGRYDGWATNALPAVSSVTANGNRSYDVLFGSTVASILSPGMRTRGTKTVAGNGYMGGAFNGTNHYFTKTTCTSTLSTVTNNITMEATYEPTAYQAASIAGRSDATPNNGFRLFMEATGQITFIIYNAAAANYRSGTTYQSIPLNKKTTIAVTYSSAVTGIYLDGISVPFSTANGGTNPTVAGTGGDFSIGRMGAYNAQYAAGYISNVAVFDAVLSQATIRQHATIKLLGSETNCIGAWSLDNTAVNQQAAGTNDLTATNSVGYTARSPHGTMGDAVQTTQFCALVMAVSGSTATLQVPEGCTIPTSGGVTSVDYSVQGNPFGWVSDKGRWAVETRLKVAGSQTSPVASTWYNLTPTSGTTGGHVLTIPVGSWEQSYQCLVATDKATATIVNAYCTLSTANNTESDTEMTAQAQLQSASGTIEVNINAYKRKFIDISSATAYYLNMRTTTASAFAIYMRGDASMTKIVALPSGL